MMIGPFTAQPDAFWDEMGEFCLGDIRHPDLESFTIGGKRVWLPKRIAEPVPFENRPRTETVELVISIDGERVN